MKSTSRLLAVEIAVEIEQVDFEQRLVPSTVGRVPRLATAGCDGEARTSTRATAKMPQSGIDLAMQRQVRRRETQRAAEPLPAAARGR